jgi:hypothetical protein
MTAENPKPFESRRGVFHPYYYIPFLGWLPQTEFMILIAVAGLALAIIVPQVQRFRHRHHPAPVESHEPAPGTKPHA